MKKQKKNAFTIIEILIVLSIFLVTSSSILAINRRTRAETALDSSQASVLNALEQARSRAASGFSKNDQGVRIEKRKIIIFEGSYVPGSGREIDLPRPVFTDQAGREIIFTRLSGKPSSAATITIIHPEGKETKIEINEEGSISK